MTLEDMKKTGSLIAARRKTLLAGVLSLGLVGTLAAESLFVGTPAAKAQTVTAPGVPQNGHAINTFSFADVVDRVGPAVVSIRVKADQPRQFMSDIFPDVPEGSPLERFFREWQDRGGPNGGPGERGNRRGEGPRGNNAPVTSQGSGFIIAPEGKIVTNFHVVKGAREVTVVTTDGSEYRATVLGSDEKTDVALVQIDEKGKTFPTVPFARNEIRVGDWVLAVGNPFGLGGSVTAGIISARGREIGAGPYDDFLQIDAPINRGNSGGPTFNLAGEVVGMNTAIFSPSGGSVGIGFAIPTSTVERVIAQLEKNGQVVRGWLGVQIQGINRDIADSLGMKQARGALVAEPQADSPAAKAGIKSGDVILAVEGKPVRNPRDLARTVAGYDPGSTVRVTLLRAGKEQDVSVVLGKLPNEQRRADAGRSGDDGVPGSTSLADLGVMVSPASEVGQGDRGVAVVRVDPAGPAASRGIEVGDLILDIQGTPVATARDLGSAISKARADGRRSVLARVVKNGETRFVPLPLASS
ncbi:Do family serine endopeptidase [Prosthecomicrobium hirschii]|uniref:Do family serine endopeptidase n=1 Tax=Prosthecodimorpha hirschii TaxID=665126 RepID=UPI00221F4EE9|nr:Do family serine endopeptidase [Prosthecomicrobium hirschii]MCW1840592.1 Do family serine endopeptidase [Prosthecomicrobium hirschii]